MSIRPGRYRVMSVKYPNSFASTGPIPRVWPPYPSPLRVFDGIFRDEYIVESKGGDSYTFKHLLIKYFVVFNDEGVKLVREDETTPVWAIDPANGPDLYRIKFADEDKYWTAADPKYEQIELKGADGDAAQEWKFVPIDRD